MRIWVLGGGSSSEREVSLRTSSNVTEALKQAGFDAQFYDVKPGHLMNQSQGPNWNSPPDLIYLGLHGTWGEDGVVQGFLESLKIPYIGSNAGSSALCFHKGLTKKILSARGVPVPMSHDIIGQEGLSSLLDTQKNSFYEKKWFIKPSRQGSTVGIERFDPTQLKDKSPKDHFKALAQKALTFDPYLLIEEWIEGREFTVALLDGKALPLVEIRPKSLFYDYKSKYTAGETEYICPAEFTPAVTKQIQDIAELSFAALECSDYGRLDGMYSDRDGPKILEMNTLPGMTATSLVPKSAKASGMDFPQFLKKLVEISSKRQGIKG